MPDTAALPARRLALLIDADNVSNKLIAPLVRQAKGFGAVVIRRAYGNYSTWSKAAVRTVVKAEAITPVLVIPATEGKDAADMKLAIDAVDLLYREHLDGICLASSDGDFASLVSHLREGGLWVCGFGEAKTPDAYRAAFDRFVVIGSGAEPKQAPAPAARRPRSAPAPAAPAATKPAPKPATPPKQASAAPARSSNPAPAVAKLPVPRDEILAAIDQLGKDDGWAHLGNIGSHLNKRPGRFDPRQFGYSTMKKLIAAVDGLETRETKSPAGNTTIHVRRKR